MAVRYNEEYAYVSDSTAECGICGIGAQYKQVLIEDAYPDGFTCAFCGDDIMS